MATPVKNPSELTLTKEPTLKPRDEAFTQKMNEYHAKRKALLDAKPSKYLEPEWDDLTREMSDFRKGYEKPQLYSLREYLLDNDPDEFQIDEVRDDIDFKGIWDLMQKGGDFYKDASVSGKGFDSAVREKLFSGMADSLGLDYDDIYYKWLGKENPNKIKQAFDNGKISQGQADDILIQRDNASKDLLKRYYAGEFDLEDLHNQLVKTHGGDLSAAFKWLLANGRK